MRTGLLKRVERFSSALTLLHKAWIFTEWRKFPKGEMRLLHLMTVDKTKLISLLLYEREHLEKQNLENNK